MMDYNKLLQGKNAVISIGVQGIGKAIAELFASQGANVLIGGRKREKLDKAIESLRHINPSACGFLVDYSKKETVYEFIEETEKHFAGRIDILVNVVGVNNQKKFECYTDDELYSMIETNLMSAFRLDRAMIPLMVKNGGGNIINISSIHALQTMPKYGGYSATKGALNSSMRAIALDYVVSGIRINTICPGLIMSDTLYEEIETYPEGRERDDFVEMLNGMQPMKPGHPSDVANAALFLASDMSSYITGQTIVVDGGATIKAHK